MREIYDCIIIGGGPAGLSAAIYLGRFNRKVLVIDKENSGRWNTNEITENYLGFPNGVYSSKLRSLGKKQAKKFGAKFSKGEVKDISQRSRNPILFEVITEENKYQTRTIILATGVRDNYPLPHLESYIGRSLFWCITCDGYKTRNKKVVIVGNTDEDACTTMQFLNFTKNLVFITNLPKSESKLSKKWLDILESAGIPVFFDTITKITGKDGNMKNILLESGEKIETDFMFNEQKAHPNIGLAQKLGVDLDRHSYIKTDVEQRTNISGVYAAGDVTKLFAHQIATAVHEGSMAGQAVNYDLYLPEQREK